jgi:hypothetical protein
MHDRLIFVSYEISLTASVAMMTAYGYQIASEDDPIIQAALESIEIISTSIFPGAVAVNTFPICMSNGPNAVGLSH